MTFFYISPFYGMCMYIKILNENKDSPKRTYDKFDPNGRLLCVTISSLVQQSK